MAFNHSDRNRNQDTETVGRQGSFKVKKEARHQVTTKSNTLDEQQIKVQYCHEHILHRQTFLNTD